MEPSNELTPGSIADTVARLIRWGRRAPEGLARAEFSSAFARQDVVSQLKSAFGASEIAFHEISLLIRQPAIDVVRDLIEKLRDIETGVVSISGFETAFSDDMLLVDSLRLLNFNRENLARPGLRQIWWMTTVFTDMFVNSAPDLDSWFILRLLLTQHSSYRQDNKSRVPTINDSYISIEDARAHAYRLAARFYTAIHSNASSLELSRLVSIALQPLVAVGEIRKATEMYTEFLESFKKLGDVTLPTDPDILEVLADLHYQRGAYAEAEPIYFQVKEIRERVLGKEHIDSINSIGNLAILYDNQGRFNEAEQLFIQVKDLMEKEFGSYNPGTLRATNNLAIFYTDQGRYEEAEALHLQVIKHQEVVLGRDHADTVNTVDNLVRVYCEQGRYDEAESLWLQFKEVRERVLGKEHPQMLQSIDNLALLYRNQGKYEEAEVLYLQTQEIRERIFGREHPSTLFSSVSLALLYERQGRSRDAESSAVDVLERYESISDKSPMGLTYVRDTALSVLRAIGKYKLARKWRERLVMDTDGPEPA